MKIEELKAYYNETSAKAIGEKALEKFWELYKNERNQNYQYIYFIIIWINNIILIVNLFSFQKAMIIMYNVNIDDRLNSIKKVTKYRLFLLI